MAFATTAIQFQTQIVGVEHRSLRDRKEGKLMTNPFSQLSHDDRSTLKLLALGASLWLAVALWWFGT